jgi:hypothetical protein
MTRREYVDKRNWVKYNEDLVRRGELYFSFEFLDSWATDIAQMNEGKVGRRYEFPEPFIQHLMMLHIILKASYRSLEGMVRKLSTYIPAIQPIDYTTIWKRGTKLDLNLSDTIAESNDPVVIAIDSTGIKVTNRGEWMREVWKVHRGWIKVHIAVNVKTKEVVGIEVTDEKVGDSKMFSPLIDQSKENLQGRKIEQADADGAYDARDAFNIPRQEALHCARNMFESTWKWGTNPGRRNMIMENAGQLKAHFRLFRTYAVDTFNDE